MTTTPEKLLQLALEASTHAYSPYSNYCVGAALLTESGQVYQGANMENASYGAAICAERTAAVQALYQGDRTFTAIAVVGYLRGTRPEEAEFAFPCGICRQFLSEFASDDMKVYMGTPTQVQAFDFWTEILPNAFRSDRLSID